MRLILLGCPGAGKGTQAKLITAKYHIPPISTGDILRAEIQHATEIGTKVKAIMESGHLVPDEIVIQIIQKRIAQPDCQQGFLLDGFPRTVTQAEALQQITQIDYVIDIDVPEEEIVKRLSGRRIHPASGRTYHLIYQPPRIDNRDDVTGESLIQRPDDKEETVRERLAVYQNQTRALKDYYQKLAQSSHHQQLQYVRINGTRSVDEIKNEIFYLLDQSKELSR